MMKETHYARKISEQPERFLFIEKSDFLDVKPFYVVRNDKPNWNLAEMLQLDGEGAGIGTPIQRFATMAEAREYIDQRAIDEGPPRGAGTPDP